MLQKVELSEKRLVDYESIVGEEVVTNLLELAKDLRGAHVLHINATAFGGGVAEILQTLIPLMRDVGLDAEWQVIEGSEDFFEVSKASHNGLQGMDIPFTKEMKDIWTRQNHYNAEHLEGNYDFIVVHDPQPAGLLHFNESAKSKHWIWRSHIDTSQSNPAFWDFFVQFIGDYDALIFTMRQYVGSGLQEAHLAIIPPTIDPRSPKNAPIALEDVLGVVTGFGIDHERPLITQVSRFDPWKDPLGVIDAYRLVKQDIPEVQLALVGSMADDDPEGWLYLDRTLRHAGEDDDIYVLHNFNGVGAFEVGCFQNASDVVIQKSTREGFGLVVTEALWKAKPVVGGNVGGIPLQVIDGETGYLVESVQACAEKTLRLLQNPQVAERMGQAGREHVRRNFLITRHLADYLKLLRDLQSG